MCAQTNKSLFHNWPTDDMICGFVSLLLQVPSRSSPCGQTASLLPIPGSTKSSLEEWARWTTSLSCTSSSKTRTGVLLPNTNHLSLCYTNCVNILNTYLSVFYVSNRITSENEHVMHQTWHFPCLQDGCSWKRKGHQMMSQWIYCYTPLPRMRLWTTVFSRLGCHPTLPKTRIWNKTDSEL